MYSKYLLSSSFLLIGPNFAYNIHSNISSTNIQTGKINNIKSTDISRIDVGGIAGAGIDLKIIGYLSPSM